MSKVSYILFSSARTGSTTLARVLRSHPQLSCVHEPFNPETKVPLECADEASLGEHLDLLYKYHAGFKHVWLKDGWPLKSITMTNSLLAYHSPRIIVLNRRNVLQQAVSFFISLQSGVWYFSPGGESERQALRSHTYPELQPSWIRGFLNWIRESSAIYEEAIAASGQDRLHIWYEDLFADGLDMAGRLGQLDSILKFLGTGQCSCTRELARVLFDPSASKMNAESSYRKIPNIDEIEALFGSAENGYLFDSTKRHDANPDGEVRAGLAPAAVAAPAPAVPTTAQPATHAGDAVGEPSADGPTSKILDQHCSLLSLVTSERLHDVSLVVSKLETDRDEAVRQIASLRSELADVTGRRAESSVQSGQ